MSEHSKIFWLFLKTPHFHMASKPQKHISNLFTRGGKEGMPSIATNVFLQTLS